MTKYYAVDKETDKVKVVADSLLLLKNAIRDLGKEETDFLILEDTNMKYVSCMVTDEDDKIVPGYNETWSKEKVRDFFVHYIRHDGSNYTKGIDAHNDYGAACRSYHTHMEYGYGNSKFPNITLAASKIVSGSGSVIKEETWIKPEE